MLLPIIKKYLTIVSILALFILNVPNISSAYPSYPHNLWMGLIAEDTSGNYQTYLMIASVVRNRLNKGMDTGLVALKRKNLEYFVKIEICYALSVKEIDLYGLTIKAIEEIFINNKDYAAGAINYEHTGVYPVPKYTKKMKLVKVMYPNTNQEITFWR